MESLRPAGLPASYRQRLDGSLKMRRIAARKAAQQPSYFQLRRLPSAIHSTAWAILLARVSGRFASTTHSTYSRRQEVGKASKVAAARGEASSAARRSSGAGSSGRGAFFGRGSGTI